MFSYTFNPTTGLHIREIRHPYRWILRHRKDIRYATMRYEPGEYYEVKISVEINDYLAIWFSFANFELAKRMMRRLVSPTTVIDRSGDDEVLWYCLVP